MQDNILIIDFMNYVHRCRVGSLDGDYVLIFNFFRNLRATVEQFEPDKIFFALEGYPKFRYDLYSNYKNNRIIKNASKKDTLDQILESANLIQKLLLLLPITLVYHPNFEADDIINTLCYNMKEENIIICSSDSDYIQILQNGFISCKLYNPIKKEFILPPSYHYVVFKALNGDKSDNIPGLLKPKKAIDTVTNPILFKKFMEVEEQRANFSINRQLIEFRLVPEEEIELKEGIKNFDLLKEEFAYMKFESILNDKSWEKYCNTFNCIKY